MRKILPALLICFIIGCNWVLAESIEAEVYLKNPATFLEDQIIHALSPSESEHFAIGYRVCKIPESEQKFQEYRHYQYEMILENKTDAPIKNLVFRAHLGEKMQILLPSPVWYCEPVTLTAYNSANKPRLIINTWTPMVSLLDLALIGGATTNDFYDCILDITWDGGQEIIYLNRDTVYIKDELLESLSDYEPLDQQEIDDMYERGLAPLADHD